MIAIVKRIFANLNCKEPTEKLRKSKVATARENILVIVDAFHPYILLYTAGKYFLSSPYLESFV